MPHLRQIGLTVNRRSKNKTLVIRSLHEGLAFSDTLVLHACFQILTDFVRNIGKENLKDKLNVDRDTGLRGIRELYDYWTVDRPLLVSKEELARDYNDRLEAVELWEQRVSTDKDRLMQLVELRQYMTPV